jgi:2-polyprenyl-6-hydroxyphenyl methylase/3-demethylubiquinone-9 3-methyltransferase
MELRFAFGKNWSNYARQIDEEKIVKAMISLQRMLKIHDLKEKTFLDIGSGSGLFSLAAARLGARVVSFDYDPHAVACTAMIKRKFEPNNPEWKIEQGSVLDEQYLASLGKFDVVYSWGVLHHTGEMWRALKNAGMAVKDGGQLFIAIYNDQGGASRRWAFVKRMYNRTPGIFKLPYIVLGGIFFQGHFILAQIANFRNPFKLNWGKEQKDRGMVAWNDLVDWMGGYPFEVARPDEIVNYYTDLGFHTERLTTLANGHGCNEFVFRNKP